MNVPDDWHPSHPGYPLHLTRVRLRTAAIVAETVLDMIGTADAKALVSRALWDLAMERDAGRAIAKVAPLAPPSCR